MTDDDSPFEQCLKKSCRILRGAEHEKVGLGWIHRAAHSLQRFTKKLSPLHDCFEGGLEKREIPQGCLSSRLGKDVHAEREFDPQQKIPDPVGHDSIAQAQSGQPVHFGKRSQDHEIGKLPEPGKQGKAMQGYGELHVGLIHHQGGALRKRTGKALHLLHRRSIPGRIVRGGKKHECRIIIDTGPQFLPGEGKIPAEFHLPEFDAAKLGLERVDAETGVEGHDVVPAWFGQNPDQKIDEFVGAVPGHHIGGVHAVVFGKCPAQGGAAGPGIPKRHCGASLEGLADNRRSPQGIFVAGHFDDLG